MKFYKKERPTAPTGDRRLDQRKASNQKAVICWKQNHTRECCITSVSLTGLFLEIPQTGLATGTALQLYFNATIDGSKKLCSEWVQVVSERENGLAVVFTHFDNQHQCNIQLILHHAVVSSTTLGQPNPLYPTGQSTNISRSA